MDNPSLQSHTLIELPGLSSKTPSITNSEALHLIENENNLEDFSIVWMDVNNENTSQRNMHLRSIVNYLSLYSNADECINYIRSVGNEKVFLITSGSDGEGVVTHVHDLSQVLVIYIFCSDATKHKKWTESYTKIGGIFVNDDLLIEKLNNDVTFYSNNLTSISVLKNAGEKLLTEKTTQILNKELATYMWFNLLIELLISLPVRETSTAKKDMINECRSQYKNNVPELKKIDDFDDNYIPNNAITWYTRDCFLYRILNKAFRTRNINLVFKYRLFIADLYNQLKTLHSKSMSTITDTEKLLIVYRGQWMTVDELLMFQENIGELISINTFFSTSISSDVACGFAGTGLGHMCFESVLLEILIDSTIPTRPFADVKDFSFIKGENEILLFPGTIFHVDEVDKYTDTLWYIKLTLANHTDEKFTVLSDFFKQEIATHPTLFTFGVLLMNMGEVDKAEQYYRLLLKELPTMHPEIGSVYNNIGICYDKKGDLKRALKNYQQALVIYATTLPVNDLDYAYTYTNIGSCYFKMGDCQQAMYNYEMALSIRAKYYPLPVSSCASLFGNIGEVLRCVGDIDNALKFYQRALQAWSSEASAYHPHTATIYNNMGLAYEANTNYELALQNYQKALDIQEKFLPPTHSDLALTFNNIGTHYYRKKSYKIALEYFTKALNIQLNSLHSHHPETAATYSNIGCIHIDEKNYEEALTNLECALEIQLKSNHSSTFITYHNIGSVYHTMKNYQLAIINYGKAIEFCLTAQNINYSQLLTTYNQIADAHKQENNIDLALENYIKALTIRLEHRHDDCLEIERAFDIIGNTCFEYGHISIALENYQKMLDFFSKNFPNHLNIANAHTSLARAHQISKNYHMALEHLHHALQIKITLLTSEHSSVGTTYNNIGEVYRKMGDHEQGKENYEKALHIYRKSLPPNHPAYAIIYQNISLLSSDHDE